MKNEELLKEIEWAISQTLESWDTPGSPEAFCFAMKHLMNLRDRIRAQRELTEFKRKRLRLKSESNNHEKTN